MAALRNQLKSILTRGLIGPFALKTRSNVALPNQVYVSTVPNPALHKASRSTNEKSDYQSHLLASSLKNNPVPNRLLEYDFDFQNDDEGLEVLESDPESSIMDYKYQDEFEKQRKKVEL